MRSRPLLIAAAGMLVVCSTPVAADSIGPMGGYLPPGYFEDVKSPPMVDSQTFITQWGLHIAPAVPNYVGFLFDLQYDGHELSSLTMVPSAPHVGLEMPFAGVTGFVPAWTFSGSQSSSQFVSPLAVWIDPAIAQQSGILIPESSVVPLFTLLGHAKNTTPLNNSDIDIQISYLGVIKHNMTSATVHLPESMWVYVVSDNPDWQWAYPGQGHWLHVPGSTTIFVPRSAFYATNFYFNGNSAGYGIEHVPEPVSALLMLSGLGAVLAGKRRRMT